MTKRRHMTPKFLLLAATMLACPLILAAPRPAAAQIGISVQIAPPVLPIYVQPPIPEVGYLWTPGYWAYGEGDYYWVPGTWVEPPQPGVLWTPPYWGWVGGAYLFHGGYWGEHVGFYGGVNYGFGYGGFGYEGGRWDGGHFSYNSRVNNFGGVHVSNTYVRNVTVNNSVHTSFNGGPGGIHAMPTAAEREAESQHHIEPTAAQTKHFETAAHTPELSARANHGHPAIAATSRPGEFAHQPARDDHAGKPEHAAESAHPAAAKPAREPGQAAPHATPHAVEHARPPAHQPKADHGAAPSEHRAEPAHEAPRAEQHAAPRPEQHAAPRPQEHAAPRPQEHAAPRPQEHEAPAHHEEHPR